MHQAQHMEQENDQQHYSPGTIYLYERAAWHYTHVLLKLARAQGEDEVARRWYLVEATLQRARARVVRRLRQRMLGQDRPD